MWVKVTDTWDSDPRLYVSRSARLLHFEAMTWSMRQGQDGRVPRVALPRLTDAADAASDAAELVESGAWEATEQGWQIIALQDDQPSADEQRQTRAAAAERQERHRRHKAGDHSKCDRCAFVTRDTTSDGSVSHSPPTRPDPTRPDPTLRGGERREAGAAAASPSARAADETTPVIRKRHHFAPHCCSLPSSNRHHWRADECPGCDYPGCESRQQPTPLRSEVA